MIIIKIKGGIGNQLFQYSFGKLLEIVYGKEVSYDLSFFSEDHRYTDRPYKLDSFNTVVRSATIEEIRKVKFKHGRFVFFLKKIVNKIFIKNYHIVYEESFIENVSKKQDFYIEGDFRSYKYTLPVIDILKKEITLKDNSSDDFDRFSNQMKNCNSVFVHIRRGDFLNGGKDLQVLDVGYYERAINKVISSIEKPQYFIFSDDIDWVKENMDHVFENPVFISNMKFTDSEEILLMSKCRHGVIANSTFSWWGATLGQDFEGRIIIYPQDQRNVYLKGDRNIHPEKWIGL